MGELMSPNAAAEAHDGVFFRRITRLLPVAVRVENMHVRRSYANALVGYLRSQEAWTRHEKTPLEAEDILLAAEPCKVEVCK